MVSVHFEYVLCMHVSYVRMFRQNVFYLIDVLLRIATFDVEGRQNTCVYAHVYDVDFVCVCVCVFVCVCVCVCVVRLG